MSYTGGDATTTAAAAAEGQARQGVVNFQRHDGQADNDVLRDKQQGERLIIITSLPQHVPGQQLPRKHDTRGHST